MIAHPEDPHEGYRNGETPAYAVCLHCGVGIRTDRTDLAREHAHLCPQPQLTKADREVLELAANGFTICETADALYLSIDAVTSRRKAAVRRVAARNLTHAVAITIRNRTISLPWPARGRKQPADELEPEPFADTRTQARQLANKFRRRKDD